jgi:hypothetical protein
MGFIKEHSMTQGMTHIKTKGNASLWGRGGSYYIVVCNTIVKATDSLREAKQWLDIFK